MKLLLDENLPYKLKYRLIENFEALTVSDMGWNGKKNGELMALILENNFDILLTSDKNLSYQQNLKKYDFPIFVIDSPDNRYSTLVEYIPLIKRALEGEIKNGVLLITI